MLDIYISPIIPIVIAFIGFLFLSVHLVEKKWGFPKSSFFWFGIALLIYLLDRSY